MGLWGSEHLKNIRMYHRGCNETLGVRLERRSLDPKPRTGCIQKLPLESVGMIHWSRAVSLIWILSF